MRFPPDAMFSTLKLLAQVLCPDPECTRSPCLFSHDFPQRPVSAPKQESATRSNAISRDPPSRPNRPRPCDRPPLQQIAPVKRARTPISIGTSLTPDSASIPISASDMVRGLTAQSSRVSSCVSRPTGPNDHRKTSAQHTKTLPSGMISRPNKVSKQLIKPNPPSSASGSVTTSHNLRAPTLNANSRLSKQPILDRMKALRRLFDEYCRLYSKLIDKDPDLPATTALRQEMDTSSATNKNSYTQAIHSVLIELRERPIPETLDSPYVGTIKESREKVRQEEELKNSALTVARVQGYMIPVSELGKYGFMTSDPGEEGDTNPDALGEEKTCDRCREKFTVSDAVDYAAFQKQAGRGECVYHWGKVQPARQEGARVWLWTCCGEARDSEGCVDGLHVFRDGYPFGHVLEEGEVPEEVLLHRRKAFKTTYQIISELNVKQEKKRKFQQTHDIVALDCEMISTTAGLALARVSVIDADGACILDRCVKPTAAILDLNTRFSGLTEEDMSNAKQDLEATRSELCSLIDENTIIIGHGLDNDLKALRLVHLRLIDTAVLFPHEKGPPFRRALRDVLSEKIGVFIQNNVLEEGHDSTADARAALDLVKWKVKTDVSAGLIQ